jgi:hypothetical protein
LKRSFGQEIRMEIEGTKKKKGLAFSSKKQRLVPKWNTTKCHRPAALTCLRGAFPPVDLRAVCLVRAIVVIGGDLESVGLK